MSDAELPEAELELRRRMREGRERKRAAEVAAYFPETSAVEGEVVAPDAPLEKRKDGRFVKGDPRIHKLGRTHGTKIRLGGQFVTDLTKWHAKYGYAAIEKVGRENPLALLQMIAGMIPREDRLDVEHRGGVALGVVDLQAIKERTRELFARIGNAVDSGSGEE